MATMTKNEERVVWLGVIAFAILLLWMTRASGQTKIAPDQLQAPRVAVLACHGSTPTSDCAGLYYVDLITPAGTELKIVGAVASGAALDPAIWSLVP